MKQSNKYLDETVSVRTQRNHNKTGKKAARKEQRRLDAIARQVKNVQKAELTLTRARSESSKEKGNALLNKANKTLSQIKGNGN